MLRIAINGFGRIGKTFLRILLQDLSNKKLTVVAINLGPNNNPEQAAQFFMYDSLLGIYPGIVIYKDEHLVIDGIKIKLFSEKDPLKLPWKELSIDWIIEASGSCKIKLDAQKHITAGALKVLISAPLETADITIIPGINTPAYHHQEHAIISLGSCTTNALAPLIKTLDEQFNLESAVITTIHAYTNDQNLMDGSHKDPRRARAAALNIIPTATGADKVIGTLFPHLASSISAIALRVPVPVVSIIDLSFVTQQPINKQKINAAFKEAAQTNLSSIMQYSTAPLVSSDFQKNKASAVFDADLTLVAGKQGKIFAWYDNEFAYCCRLKEFLTLQFIKV